MQHAYGDAAVTAWSLLALQDGSGTANTSVVFHAKQLLALQEQDMPYVVRSTALHPCTSCLQLGGAEHLSHLQKIT